MRQNITCTNADLLQVRFLGTNWLICNQNPKINLQRKCIWICCLQVGGNFVLFTSVTTVTSHSHYSSNDVAVTLLDDVIKWNHFPRWRGALMFSLICVWINGWVNNGDVGDLRRHRAHYGVTVRCSGCRGQWSQADCDQGQGTYWWSLGEIAHDILKLPA